MEYNVPQNKINEAPIVYAPSSTIAHDHVSNMFNGQLDAIDVFDTIRSIRDPEHPHTLEELKVLYEEGIHVAQSNIDCPFGVITIFFTPTVKHCSLVSHIGLCIRKKLFDVFGEEIMDKYKVDIYVTKGSHNTEDEVNKLINDKERVAAATEIPALMELINQCVQEY